MASVGKEEVEYESDPEEAKMSLKMRRREASDDEEEEGDGRVENLKHPRRIESEGESEGEGAAAEYDDDLDEEELEVDEEIVEEEYEDGLEEELEGEDEEYEVRVGEGSGSGGNVEVRAVAASEREAADEGDNDVGQSVQGHQGISNQAEEGEEKKENEPFAVPTAGAFYMHDDRFRDNAGGRHRRTLGGRKLWELKDDKKWGHDKFEELTMHERHYEESRRNVGGRYRGRGKSRGSDRGYPRPNRSKTYNNNSNNNNNQNNAPKAVRGRGPRRYQPSMKNNGEAPPTRNKQSEKSAERTSHASSGRVSAPALNLESDPVLARKNVFGSSLNSASPPFYPSGSSNKEIPSTHKRELQGGKFDRNPRASAMNDSFSVSQPNAAQRGKNVVDPIGMDKLHIDDSIPPVAVRSSANSQMQPSGSPFAHSTQSSQFKAQGRGPTPMGQMAYQPITSHNQVNRASQSSQNHAQNRVQHSSQASGNQFTQRPSSGSQSSSPPKVTLPINSSDPREVDSTPESSKSKNALVGIKGKGTLQGSGRGSFLYGGAQVMGSSGNMSTGHGDPNFPGAPAFLQVMQFGGQHPGGLGVPAVGMAFPGYVAQPQGLGNSEMTWLPVLAGAAGALGATYCSPYLVDGNYHARPSGQMSSLVAPSSKENNTNKPGGESKPSQGPELTNDEYGQQQNNRRRYTEMKFDQMK